MVLTCWGVSVKEQPGKTYVVLLAGTLPPDADLSKVGPTIMSAVTLNLPLIDTMRASVVAFGEEEPGAMVKRLAALVAPTITKPTIVQ